MTFDLDAPTTQARERARRAAAALADAARQIDAGGVIDDALRAQARDVLAAPADRLAWVVGLEELAAVSGSLAMDAALAPGRAAAPDTPSRTWMGLRGVAIEGLSGSGHVLGTAAVLIGLGRAALDAALSPLRERHAGGDKSAVPHWALADAATELDAARLLTWRAASATGEDATVAAMARLQARTAAEAAVTAARRVLDASHAVTGTDLDRITRDVATLTLIVTSADVDETAVAAGVLPG